MALSLEVVLSKSPNQIGHSHRLANSNLCCFESVLVGMKFWKSTDSTAIYLPGSMQSDKEKIAFKHCIVSVKVESIRLCG